MRGDIFDFTKNGNIFVIHVKTSQPPGWTIRAGLTYGDSLKVLALLLRPKTLFSVLFGWMKKAESPEEF
jgi:hypothetical protein